MTLASISSQTPIEINGTAVPFVSGRYSPGVNGTTLPHSGLKFPTSYIRGLNDLPQITLSGVPFRSAYELIGRESLNVTALKYHLTNYTNGAKVANTNVYQLSTNSGGFATITGISMGQTLTADITIGLFNTVGNAVPIESTTAVEIPQLSAEPSYYVLGPSERDGTVLTGATGFSASTGNSMVPIFTDGNRYPTGYVYITGDFTGSVPHNAPRTIIGDLTHTGVTPSTSYIQYFRLLSGNVTTGAINGCSISIASASLAPMEVGQSTGQLDTGGFMFQALDATQTQTPPWAVSFTATVP